MHGTLELSLIVCARARRNIYLTSVDINVIDRNPWLKRSRSFLSKISLADLNAFAYMVLVGFLLLWYTDWNLLSYYGSVYQINKIQFEV